MNVGFYCLIVSNIFMACFTCYYNFAHVHTNLLCRNKKMVCQSSTRNIVFMQLQHVISHSHHRNPQIYHLTKRANRSTKPGSQTFVFVFQQVQINQYSCPHRPQYIEYYRQSLLLSRTIVGGIYQLSPQLLRQQEKEYH